MLGIFKKYTQVIEINQELILNEKVVEYIYNKIKYLKEKNRHFVLKESYSSYTELTKEVIEKLLVDNYYEDACIRELDNDPEYEDCPYTIEHASPYDHRWPGDYDKDAYNDWKEIEYSLLDFLKERNDPDDPFKSEFIYAKYPELFDFKKEDISIKDKSLIETCGYKYPSITNKFTLSSLDDFDELVKKIIKENINMKTYKEVLKFIHDNDISAWQAIIANEVAFSFGQDSEAYEIICEWIFNLIMKSDESSDVQAITRYVKDGLSSGIFTVDDLKKNSPKCEDYVWGKLFGC